MISCCGVCKGQGKILLVMPIRGTKEIVACTNCGGTGYVIVAANIGFYIPGPSWNDLEKHNAD